MKIVYNLRTVDGMNSRLGPLSNRSRALAARGLKTGNFNGLQYIMNRLNDLIKKIGSRLSGRSGSTVAKVEVSRRSVLQNRSGFFFAYVNYLATVLFIFVVSNDLSADIVRYRDAAGAVKSQTGTITGITSKSVRVNRMNATSDIPANTIVATQYEGEPPFLTTLRSAIQSSRYVEALESIGKINPGEISGEYARQDFEFFKVLAIGKLAILGKESVPRAQAVAADFLKNSPESYHFYDACEILAELFTLGGKPNDAASVYAELTKAPWPQYALKASLSLGRTACDSQRFADAKTRFETVLQSQDDTAETLRLKTLAQIGLANCLIGEKQFDTAIGKLEELAGKINPEDATVCAAVYNALGAAQEQASHPKEAILAYLHVEILYSACKPEYKKALDRLALLWRQTNHPQRAAETEQKRKELN